MNDKLTERLDIPKCVRNDEVLRAKLNIVMFLRGRNLASQVRHSILRGVDQEFAELGKEAFEMLCRQMSARVEQPAVRLAMSADVGSGRKRSVNVGNSVPGPRSARVSGQSSPAKTA